MRRNETYWLLKVAAKAAALQLVLAATALEPDVPQSPLVPLFVPPETEPGRRYLACEYAIRKFEPPV